MDIPDPIDPLVSAMEAVRRSEALMMAERKRAEEALGHSEQRYRLLFDANPIMLMVHDVASLRILAVNEATVNFYGYSRQEFLAMTAREVWLSEDFPALRQALQAAGDANLPASLWRHRKRDGTIFDVEVQSSFLVFGGQSARLVMIIDVSERTRLEEHMREIRKMETIGQLAGGIAHDFNNLLTVIHGRSSLLLSSRQVAGDAAEAVLLIKEAAEKAGDLTRQLLTFSRKQALSLETVDLNRTVGTMSRMLQRVLGEDIALELKLSPETGPVRADASMMDQVVMNLAVNARDAMPRGGRLTVSTSRVVLEGRMSRPSAELTPGEYACLCVADTGTGISAEHVARVFDPFFTTKELGRGTGLGLATVQAIVRQHRGSIDVISAPGRGTEFRILLPVTGEPPSPPLVGRNESQDIQLGTETILLVEDEQPVREVIKLALRQAGYRVLEAEDGQAALDLWAQHKERIDMVLTDVLMPGNMNGHELAASLRAERPGLKVVYVSGYSPDIAGKELQLGADTRYLQKPFSLAALTRSIRDSLDRR